MFYQHIRTQRLAYVDASSAAVEGKSLSDAQNKALSQWREIEKTFIPNREDVKINTSKMKSDYATVAGYLRPLSFQIQTVFLPIIIWDSLTLMLLGAALYQWGFFSGAWSNRNYWQILTIGYQLTFFSVKKDINNCAANSSDVIS